MTKFSGSTDTGKLSFIIRESLPPVIATVITIFAWHVDRFFGLFFIIFGFLFFTMFEFKRVRYEVRKKLGEEKNNEKNIVAMSFLFSFFLFSQVFADTGVTGNDVVPVISQFWTNVMLVLSGGALTKLTDMVFNYSKIRREIKKDDLVAPATTWQPILMEWKDIHNSDVQKIAQLEISLEKLEQRMVDAVKKEREDCEKKMDERERLLMERIEAMLATGKITFKKDYPKSEAS